MNKRSRLKARSVAFVFLQLADQEFDGVGRTHRIQDAAQHIGLGQIRLVDQQVLFPGAGLQDVHRREDALVHQFAIEVDFPNSTWIHGGPQLLDDGSLQANWGGLVDRGGGDADYDLLDWKKDVLLIQCGVGKPNTVPWSWQFDREYVLTVRRGQKVRLPAGTLTIDEETFRAPARTMWEWHFTIEPLKPRKGDRTFSSLCYDSADSIADFALHALEIAARHGEVAAQHVVRAGSGQRRHGLPRARPAGRRRGLRRIRLGCC